MRCPKCNGTMFEIDTGDPLTDHTSCINCGKVIYEHPGKPELNQGCRTRGHDRHRRAPYGVCREITDEDWSLGNKVVAEKYGISESWASHLRPVKKYRRRDAVGLSDPVQDGGDTGAGGGMDISPSSEVEDRPGLAGLPIGGGDRGGSMDAGKAQ